MGIYAMYLVTTSLEGGCRAMPSPMSWKKAGLCRCNHQKFGQKNGKMPGEIFRYSGLSSFCFNFQLLQQLVDFIWFLADGCVETHQKE